MQIRTTAKILWLRHLTYYQVQYTIIWSLHSINLKMLSTHLHTHAHIRTHARTGTRRHTHALTHSYPHTPSHTHSQFNTLALRGTLGKALQRIVNILSSLPLRIKHWNYIPTVVLSDCGFQFTKNNFLKILYCLISPT